MLKLVLLLSSVYLGCSANVFVGYNRINADNVYYNPQNALSYSAAFTSFQCIDACGQISTCNGVSIATTGAIGGHKCILYQNFDPTQSSNWFVADSGTVVVNYEVWKYSSLSVKILTDMTSNLTNVVGMLDGILSGFKTSQSASQVFSNTSPKECVRVCNTESTCQGVVLEQVSTLPDVIHCHFHTGAIADTSYVDSGTKKYITVVKDSTTSSTDVVGWLTGVFGSTENIIIISAVGIPVLSILISLLSNVIGWCRGNNKNLPARPQYVVLSPEQLKQVNPV